MGQYRQIVIETYRNPGEPSSKAIRARPIAGQGFSTTLNIECSSKMRLTHPVGTHMIVRAKVTTREGTPFLYTHYSWPYRVVSEEEAKQFIQVPRKK